MPDECVTNDDCRNGGQCVDTGATSYPVKQCYCPAGWHGAGCALRSSVTDLTTIQLDQYTPIQLNDGMTLFWRLITQDFNEVEMVVKAKTRSWIGIGWKPYGNG